MAIVKKITQTFQEPNIADTYGPYESIEAAHAALSGDRLNVIGMTVGIVGANGIIQEYWYQGGTELANIVQKQVGGDKPYQEDSYTGMGKVNLMVNLDYLGLPFLGFDNPQTVNESDILDTENPLIFWDDVRRDFVARPTEEAVNYYAHWINDSGYKNLTTDSWFYLINDGTKVFYKFDGTTISVNTNPVKTNILTQDMLYKGEAGSRVPNTNTIFVIQDDFNLNNDVIEIPEGCVLEFDGGSLSNGVLVGSNTDLQGTMLFGANIALNGTFIKYESLPTWIFKGNYNAIDVFKNISFIAKAVELEDEKHYSITKNDYEITIDKIFSKSNAYIDFVEGETTTAAGINIECSGSFCLENLTITEDYQGQFEEHTLGNAFNILTNDASISVKNCTFSGMFYSSAVASSHAAIFTADNCKITGKYCDHVFYCSTRIKYYKVSNCKIYGETIMEGGVSTVVPVDSYGLFKVRNSPNCTYILDNIYGESVRNYCAYISNMDSPNITITNVHLDFVQDATFGYINASNGSINIESSYIHQTQESGYGLFRIYGEVDYPASSNSIIIDNCDIKCSNIIFANQVVTNSKIDFVGSRNINVNKNTKIVYKNVIVTSSLANSESPFNVSSAEADGSISIVLINCNVNADAIYAFKTSVPTTFAIDVTLVNTVMFAYRGFISTSCPYNLNITNSVLKSSGAYSIYGTLLPQNLQKGTTAQRPISTEEGRSYNDITLGKNIFYKVKRKRDSLGAYTGVTTITNNIQTGGYFYLKTHLGKTDDTFVAVFTKTSSAPIDDAENIQIPLTAKGEDSSFRFESDILTAPDITVYPYIRVSFTKGSSSGTRFMDVNRLVWNEADGATTGISRIGTAAERPFGNDIYVGFQYMQVDTINGTFPIWASAISGDTVTWVKADGTDPDNV